MPTDRGQASADDPAFASLIDALAAMPRSKRNALLSFFDYWHSLPWESRAKLVKTTNPALTDEEIARICGRSRRHLLRNDGYKCLKTRLTDLLKPERRRGRRPEPPET
jgi:hypothetical protein